MTLAAKPAAMGTACGGSTPAIRHVSSDRPLDAPYGGGLRFERARSPPGVFEEGLS